MIISQIENLSVRIEKIRNEKRIHAKVARESSDREDKPKIYAYGSKAIKKRFSEFKFNQIPFTQEFEPNPFVYQYDLELYIFLHYDKLKAEELELTDNDNIIEEYGPTGFDRREHLLNAMAIRWPSKTLPTGQKIGDVLITPWLEDFAFGVSEYSDVVCYGGAGQGKTYGPLAMMCMIFDHFIYTRSGAQCSYSTVSEIKLKSSTWGYVNKIYPLVEGRKQFSLYAGKAKRSPEYTFSRVDLKGKKIENGGRFQGVLLQKGIKDARVIDKLTGSHDAIARIYLLDEAQTTDSAPVDARANMFLHPKHGWFIMCGNYEDDKDLLGINIVPNVGWKNIDEKTHIYEGSLKSFKGSLSRKTCVIHYNNDLSPAITNPSLAKVFQHLPNKAKRDSLYPTKVAKESYGYKRFWIGFRFQNKESENITILDENFLHEYKAHEDGVFQGESFMIGSFDPAPASVDRNIFTTLRVGLSRDTGLPLITPGRIYSLPAIKSQIKYNSETVNAIKKIIDKENIESGNIIIDFTYRHTIIESLQDAGIICHYIIYNNAIPKKRQLNPISKSWEDKIDLETMKTFAGTFEKNSTLYAHEKLKDRITVGAYVMRMFIEKGIFKGFRPSILDKIEGHNGFEKEFLLRTFKRDKKNIISLDLKDSFKKVHHFSPDISDTFYQAFYLIYVILKIRPNKSSLGLLRTNKSFNMEKKSVDKMKKIWYPQISF